jgi:signal peptidase II
VHLALGLITAGALGNLYDRAMYHGVRDMLRFLCFHFHVAPVTILGYTYPSGPAAPDGAFDWYPYIFNIADVCLCVGVPLLIARWLFVKDGDAAPAAPAHA